MDGFSHEAHLRRPGGDVCHEGHILDEADGLAFGGLGGTHHAPVRIVKLARLGLLPRASERGVATAEVGEGGGIGQSV
jgi:hypothetical protein